MARKEVGKFIADGITFTVIDGLQCPRCGVGETHPEDAHKELLERRLTIRGFKIDMGKGWESQCLVCSGYYDKDLKETPQKHDGNKGWFL